MSTPMFTNPPIVELVLGVQFSPLTKFRSGHFGLFWKTLGEAWTEPSDGAPIEEQFETFDTTRWTASPEYQLRIGSVPYPGRFVLGHRDRDRLIQVQANRFHLNWRKRDRFYPSYNNLITEFEETFDKFTTFVEGAGVGTILPNQWELTYIDAFPKGESWQTLADWSKVLPGLFGELFPTDNMKMGLDHRAAEWSFELQPRLGRLRVAAHPGHTGNDKIQNLLLTMTARGPIVGKDVAALRTGLDLGHAAAVETFLRVTAKTEQLRWGIQS